ncbi:hypothetical protein BCR37DRAFT_345063 [Protomyces lactucae-debilis]|uniref:Peroxisomal biogenesis factor 11 n=1 Tax=Protomyces lactucae-debilis TaxID=2754530 RepID=A0A1Y2FMQ3_PROLT|nr:uncharacterized protein BCR37DRAFT_345063 [Protomyces lactucae-debilis]ORY84867.1 hypothetical protein BCR37DRAFT_345063 [Protomyces lactucae-debilis]
MQRFAKLASSAGGVDRILMLVQYSLTLVLPSLVKRTLDPKALVTGQALTTAQLLLSAKRLRDLCSDYRIFARLVGYPAIHSWGIGVYNKPASARTGPIPSWIEDIQVLVNLAYQPMENAAYLSQHGILPLSKQTENKLWTWSCRMWAAHVFLDLYKLMLERQSTPSLQSSARIKTKEQQQARVHWLREVIINLAYAPLTLHWSAYQGIGLSERQVGALGLVAAVGQISKAWELTK